MHTKIASNTRYFNEASLRLDPKHWTLMKQGQPKVPTITKFLSNLATEHYKSQGLPLKVGIDPYVHSASFAKELNEAFEKAARDVEVNHPDGTAEAAGTLNGDVAKSHVIGVIDTLEGKSNLVDSIWDGRPELPKNPFRVQVRNTDVNRTCISLKRLHDCLH
jgi:Xaa-Pro aminopeptidase